MARSGSSKSTSNGFDELLEFLKQTRGVDFAAYKPATIHRRIEKRMAEVGSSSYADYQRLLEVEPDEFAQLFDTVLINVTSFFRDPDAWDALRAEVLPGIVERRTDEIIRVWTAGCASGEETYTIAMILCELIGPEAFRSRVKIYATDVDDAALSRARHAVYTAEQLEPVPEQMRREYFRPEGSRFAFRQDLRGSMVFGNHDLLRDPPMSRLDLLLCRNTLMYFNAEAQGHVLARFHFALTEHGALFLGRAEMLLTHTDLFLPIDLKHRIFRKTQPATVRDRLIAGARIGGETIVLDDITLLRDAAIDNSPFPLIAVDADKRLVVANRTAREQFALDVRDLGRPFQDLELSYRPAELRVAIEQSLREGKPVRLASISHVAPDGSPHTFDVDVRWFYGQAEQPIGATVVFEDITSAVTLTADLERSRQELETAYEELQSTNEELETTNEELQSTIEELETTNEELQSTNEELETMNEELQSTNAELEATNNELQQRTEDLNRTNAFKDTILGSLPAGVIVVDHDLVVIGWNASSRDLWGLSEEEAVGQRFADLDVGLPVIDLAGMVRATISGDGERNDTVVEAVQRRGHKIRCRVVCSRMHAPEYAPGGAIISVEQIGGSDD